MQRVFDIAERQTGSERPQALPEIRHGKDLPVTEGSKNV